MSELDEGALEAVLPEFGPADEFNHYNLDHGNIALLVSRYLAKAGDGWRPISEAPAKGKFWCQRPSPNDDELMLVQRGLKEHGENAVISYRIGKFWWPSHFLPLSAAPTPPPKEPINDR